MDTIYRMKESTVTGELKPVSVWLNERFQKFAAIVVSTGLLLTLVALLNLKANVDNLTEKKVPYIQSQIGRLPGG